MSRSLLVALATLAACGEGDAHEPVLPSSESRAVNRTAYNVCCLERAAACNDPSAGCEGCGRRCLEGCADGATLMGCLNANGITLACQADGTIRPAGNLCTKEFDEYQAAALSCGPAACAVGHAPPSAGSAGSGGSP